jgi:alkaline phosphatase D
MIRSQRCAFFVLGFVGAAVCALGATTGNREIAAGRLGQADLRARVLPVLRGESISGVYTGAQFFPQSVASGDPTSGSVIVWTRVDDPLAGDADVPVRAIVSADPFFLHVVYNQVVLAQAAYDHCVKIKVTGLDPATSYLYFFVYDRADGLYVSQLGHTKTAPDPGSDVPVHFAFLSCQDYTGRYYNTLAELVRAHPNDLDFVAYLGDYIYETTPTTDEGNGRHVVFSDPDSAIVLSDASGTSLAASSLSNYRDLYKTYRSDPMLQRLEERYPLIAIWDDHEYSDDCWGDVATYFNGRKDEADPVRRRNAERAFFEYMPIDRGLDANGVLAIDDSVLYPNASIYREFHYGANLDLVMTDYRSYRPAPLVPDDAFPGSIVLDKATLTAALGQATYSALAPSLDPYLNVGDDPVLHSILTSLLTGLYQRENPFFTPADAAAKAAAVTSGNVSATYIGALFEGAGQASPFDPAALAAMDRGMSALYLGKQDLYSRLGSRYVLAKDPFGLYAAVESALTGGEAENAFGDAQMTWLTSALTTSAARWRVVASSVSMTPMILDFVNPANAALLPPDFPASYRIRILLDADEWDGFPDMRDQLIRLFQSVGNTVVISGDIHASFITDHGGGVFEFTGPAVSSATIADGVAGVVAEDPLLANVSSIGVLVHAIGQLLRVSSLDPSVSPATILDDYTHYHGYVVVDVDADALHATYEQTDSDNVGTDLYDDPSLDGQFTSTTYTVHGGMLDLP